MAQGNLERLEPAVKMALDNGVTINELKEAFSQLYAYTGFPRSLNALGVLNKVLENKQASWQEGKPWTRPAEWNDAKAAYAIESLGEGCFSNCMNLTELEIKGEKICEIRANTFSGSFIRSVKIPGSIGSIDVSAFKECPNLNNIIFGEGTPFVFDGSGVYLGTKLILLMSSVISYSLPSGIVEIQDGDRKSVV